MSISVSLLGIGAALGKLVLRAGGHADGADALTDAAGGLAALRNAFRARPDSVAQAIANGLTVRLGGVPRGESREFEAAAYNARWLFEALAEDPRATVAAAAHPEDFYEFVMANGGAATEQQLATAARPLFRSVVRAAAGEFAILSPNSPRFAGWALSELLRAAELLPRISEDVRAVRDAVSVAACAQATTPPLDVDPVSASRRATALDSPAVGDWESLGIHPAMDPQNQTVAGLTPYIRRHHDDLLDEILARVVGTAARGPRMALMQGGSSTGKTRALREAVLRSVPEWPLVRPSSAAEMDSLVRRGIPGGTVVWLDEFQNFVAGEKGPSVIEALIALLTTRAVPPFLVVATLWPDTKNVLLSRPQDPVAAPHRLAELFRAVSIVEADTDFSTADPDAVRVAALADPRVAEAIATSGGLGGSLTQTLAGGPLLAARYDGSAPLDAVPFSPAAISVLTATAELSRMGIAGRVPATIVTKAALGHLSPEEVSNLSEDWATDAIAEAAAPFRGVRALTTRGMEPGHTDTVELHDYLQQYYLVNNRITPTRYSSWEAVTAVRHAIGVEVVTAVGVNALERGLTGTALTLLTSAVERGGPGSSARNILDGIASTERSLAEVDRLRHLIGQAEEDLTELGAPNSQRHQGMRERRSETLYELQRRLWSRLAWMEDPGSLQELWLAATSSEPTNSHAAELYFNRLMRQNDPAAHAELDRAASQLPAIRTMLHRHRTEQGQKRRLAKGKPRSASPKQGKPRTNRRDRIVFVDRLATQSDPDSLNRLRTLSMGRNPYAHHRLIERLLRDPDESNLAEVFAMALAGDEYARTQVISTLQSQADEPAVALLRNAVHAGLNGAAAALICLYQRRDARRVVGLTLDGLPELGRWPAEIRNHDP